MSSLQRRPPEWFLLEGPRKFAINGLVIIASMLGVGVVLKDALKQVAVIDTISVPEDLEADGYTPATMGNRIIDAVTQISRDAAMTRRKLFELLICQMREYRDTDVILHKALGVPSTGRRPLRRCAARSRPHIWSASQMLGVFAEFEHSIIQERVRAGLQRAKREGTRLGRPPIANKLAERIRAALAGGMSVRKTAARST
jgi:Resolvase, N terminal domain